MELLISPIDAMKQNFGAMCDELLRKDRENKPLSWGEAAYWALMLTESDPDAARDVTNLAVNLDDMLTKGIKAANWEKGQSGDVEKQKDAIYGEAGSLEYIIRAEAGAVIRGQRPVFTMMARQSDRDGMETAKALQRKCGDIQKPSLVQLFVDTMGCRNGPDSPAALRLQASFDARTAFNIGWF